MFNSSFKILSLLILLLLIQSCNTRKKEELEADNQLIIINNLIKNNEYNNAKIKIDSFHISYPRLVEKRRIAAAQKDTIIRRESSRTLIYCDSIYPLKKHEFDSISKKFHFEKDTAYQKYGNYVHKSQITEQNPNRNYLKCTVNENADLQLISNYSGSKIAHKWIEVRIGDIFAVTDTTNQSNSYEHYYNDGNDYFERVMFENKSAENIIRFIYNNKNSGIKVTLNGSKNYKYNLNFVDIKAIADTYHLWVVKKDILKLEIEIQKAKIKIQKINLRKKQ